ncbi:MAG: hypothetical protein EOO54_14800 [Haliea sp.]|nr:MAG: hypothetical protein EOO54_14800 [Haliea sp.]
MGALFISRGRGPALPAARRSAPSGLATAAPKLLEQLWTGARREASGERRPARCSDPRSGGAWGLKPCRRWQR